MTGRAIWPKIYRSPETSYGIFQQFYNGAVVVIRSWRVIFMESFISTFQEKSTNQISPITVTHIFRGVCVSVCCVWMSAFA